MKPRFPRFKVWKIDPDGEPGTLLLRTGSMEQGDLDLIYVGEDPGSVARVACNRLGFSGRVLVKNFDTGLWYTVTVSGDAVDVTQGRS